VIDTFFSSLAEEAFLGLLPDRPPLLRTYGITNTNADEPFPRFNVVKRGDLLGDAPRFEFAKGDIRAFHSSLRGQRCSTATQTFSAVLATSATCIIFPSLGASKAVLPSPNRIPCQGYLLKTAISDILGRRQVNVVKQKLDEWISWASRSRLPSFKKVARTIKKHLDGIVAIVATGLNNGRTEGLNGKIRVITRRAYGFHNAQALIGFIFLCCSGVILHPVFKTPGLR